MNFIVHFSLKNTRLLSTTIDSSKTLYNGKPAEAYEGYTPGANFTRVTLASGKSVSIAFELNGGSESPWVSGMTLEIMIAALNNWQYPKVVPSVNLAYLTLQSHLKQSKRMMRT